jgi:hypothetical protein
VATNVERARSSTPDRRIAARLTTETKQAFKTTEFYAFLIVCAGILVASRIIGGGDGDPDTFKASQAWLYVAIVTTGYLVSRGLAKAGSRDPYWADSDDLPNR